MRSYDKMCHLYLTKCQYKSDLIHEFHVCLKGIITRTYYRLKDACLQVKTYVTQARTIIDLFRLSVTEQSNDVLKQVVIAYEIYPH